MMNSYTGCSEQGYLYLEYLNKIVATNSCYRDYGSPMTNSCSYKLWFLWPYKLICLSLSSVQSL